MGNKIITEKDFFECSGGMMPSPFQARQLIVKRQDGAKYITKDDISTVSWVDFGCKKAMLLYAVVAAVAAAVAALCVATGGAALIAVCAVAGAAGAVLGAVAGTLICGQLVAPTRKWIGNKADFKIQGINTISGDHYIQCDAFTYLGMSAEYVTFNPQIKSWSQAIAKAGAAFIGNVLEGMMAGAAIGGIAAGGAALLSSGSWAGAGNVALQFVKSIPKNIAGNIIESFMVPGLTIRGVLSAQNVAAGYGETGEMSAGQFGKNAVGGFFSMETGTVDSFKNVSTGNGTWQDYVGLALNLMPVGKGTRDFLDGKKKLKSKKVKGDAYEMGYRQDSNPYSNQGKTEGRLKSHIDTDGNLIPANKDGVATVQDHIRGSEPRKSDSPYTSFSKDAPSPGKVYGDQTITVDLTKLEADIQSGKVKDVEVLRPEQVQAEMQGKVDDAQAKYDQNPSKKNQERLDNTKRDLENTTRDNEILIKGEVPSEYIEVKPTNE